MEVQISNEWAAQLKVLEDKLNDSQIEHERLRTEQQSIVNELVRRKVQCALDSNFFLEHFWKTSGDFLCREVYLISHTKHHKLLSDFFQTDYHCSVDLDDGVRLIFSDWDIHLYFKNPEIAKIFIKKHNLKIDISDAIKNLEYHQTELERLNNYISMVKEIQGLNE